MTAKANNMRRTVGEFLMSACAMSIVLITIIAVDGRVREKVTSHIDSAQATTDAQSIGAATRYYANTTIVMVKDQAQTHPAIAIFLVVGTMLTAFMLRT